MRLEQDTLEQDTTEYLLSSEANRQHLLEAIERVEKGEGLVKLRIEDL